mgnify:CR=1 FL=1
MKTNKELLKENAELRDRISELEKAISEAVTAMISEEEALADIKADAIMEVANNWIIRKGSDFNIRRKLTAISNKIRGESCVSIKSQSN